MPEDNPPYSQFLAPRFWPTWFGLGLMRVLVLLPLSIQRGTGRLLGRLARHLMGRRRRVAETNLALSFPQLSEAERRDLLIRHFESLGIALFETAFTWWAADSRLEGLDVPEGIEHIHRARAEGKGVILLSAHFTTLEIGCRLLLRHESFHPMYRRHENPLFEKVMRGSRERLSDNPIRRDDVRELLRSLRQGQAVWYAPDQAYRGRHAAQIPFFGVPAATNLATSRLARVSGAPVLPFFSFRLANGQYRLVIQPPLENFPGEDPESDGQRINRIIEDAVRLAPEQYLWVHRRFKATRPGNPDPYAPDRAV